MEFRLGEIEHLPVGDASVDVIISNCVINLSPDKAQVWREIARVLRPGGRVAVSDLALLRPLPEEIGRMVEALVGCVAGALEESEFKRLLTKVGFQEPDIEPTRTYQAEDARAFLSEAGLDVDSVAPQIDGKFMAAFVRATKPVNNP